MVNILKDIHLAEALAQSAKTNVKDSLLALYYNDIYRIHGIAKEDLERNIELWMSDAHDINRLYEKVIEELSKEESEYAKRKPTSPIPNKKPKVLEKTKDKAASKQQLKNRNNKD